MCYNGNMNTRKSAELAYQKGYMPSTKNVDFLSLLCTLKRVFSFCLYDKKTWIKSQQETAYCEPQQQPKPLICFILPISLSGVTCSFPFRNEAEATIPHIPTGYVTRENNILTTSRTFH